MKGGWRGISPLPLPPYGRWGVEIALIIMFPGIFLLTTGILLTLHDFVYSSLPEYLNIFLSSNSFWLFFRFFCMYREYIIIKRRIQPPFFLFVCFFILSSSSKISRAVFNKSNECNHLYLILHLRENYFNTSSCCLMLSVSFSYTA